MLVRSFKPTLVLTDIDLRDMDGLDFIQQNRGENKRSVVVVSAGKDVHLTPLEYRILSMLIDNAGRVLTYDRILQAWTTKQNRHLHDVRAFMWRLRRKLESDPTKPSFLISASGLGYQFQLVGQ